MVEYLREVVVVRDSEIGRILQNSREYVDICSIEGDMVFIRGYGNKIS